MDASKEPEDALQVEVVRSGNWPVAKAETVAGLFKYIDWREGHWAGAKEGDLAFRGQAVSDWGLVPKAFREDLSQEAAAGTEKRRVGRQALAEFRLFRELWTGADALGVDVPDEVLRLVTTEKPSEVFQTEAWADDWPQEEMWSALALAQHHGLTTRLLDFTEKPLVAAFWAAYHAWKRREKGYTVVEEPFIAVWVIDLRFIRGIDEIKGNLSERIGVIKVPKSRNRYLHAQSGFFLIDRGANDVMNVGKSLSLENAVIERAQFWQHEDRLTERGITRTWFDDVPIRQVILGSECVPMLLRELATLGVTKGSLMPSLDNIAEGIALGRALAQVH